MCGIVGLHLRDDQLRPRLGALLAGMVGELAERGPDSAGFGIYGDPRLTPSGRYTLSLLGVGLPAAEASARIAVMLPGAGPVSAVEVGDVLLVRAPVNTATLAAAVARALPEAQLAGQGTHLAVFKGVGHPAELAARFQLRRVAGDQALAHTRMATESAITAAHCHPFAVDDDLCLVHNGSFANHATIRRELMADGVSFDSDNDSEVAARYLAARLADGEDLEKALRRLCERFDGFYTLLVTTADTFAVVRDAIACKPALLAVTDRWVAMASEYRALSGLPGIEAAHVFEPEPEEVYLWRR
jgi:amidophosphoribosyltransferase